MNEEIIFPGHRGTPLEVILSSFATDARSFYDHALDHNLDIEELKGEELEQAMDKYYNEFSSILDNLEYLLEGINDIVCDVGNAVPTDE